LRETWRRFGRKALSAALAIAALFSAATFVTSSVTISPTPSDGYHVFLYRRSFGEIQQGDYVMFRTRTDLVDRCREGCYLIKRVVCTAGQRLRVRNREFFCDGVFLGRAKTRSKKGVPVQAFRYDGVIPEGMLFVMGCHPDSYDSRYFGFVRVSDVEAVARPLF